MDPRPQYGVPGGYGGDYYGNPVVATMGGQSYYLPPGAVDPHGQPLYLPLPTNLYTTGLPHVPRHQHQRHIMDLSVNEELRMPAWLASGCRLSVCASARPQGACASLISFPVLSLPPSPLFGSTCRD